MMNLLNLLLHGSIFLSPYTQNMLRTNPSPVNGETPMQTKARVLYQWNVLEYNFPTKFAEMEANSNGNLIPTNAMPIDVQPHYSNKHRLRTFVTIPKFTMGIPYSLATVLEEKGPNGPLLQPYPNYEFHNNSNGKNCDAITSAFRVTVTECNQMWVLDSGMVAGQYQCPPQLLLFDLNTDQLTHRFRFDTSIYIPTASLFVTPIVNVKDPPPRGSCRRTMIYVADVSFHGLVVYDFMHNNAWRIENLYMYPDPNYGNHTVAGESFVLMDGIIGLETDKTNLYFHPMASIKEFTVPLNVIENRKLFENNIEANQNLFRPLGKRSSECVASAMDSNKNMYCVTFNPIELISWNVNTRYDINNIKKLPINPEELQFVSGIKVVRNHQGNEELWMLSNRYQKMAAATRNFNEINFRIVVLPLVKVIPTNPDEDLHNKLVFKN